MNKKALLPLFLAAATAAFAQDTPSVGLTMRQDAAGILQSVHSIIVLEAEGRSATAQPEDDTILLSLDAHDTGRFVCDDNTNRTLWLRRYIGLSAADMTHMGHEIHGVFEQAANAMYEHLEMNRFSNLTEKEETDDFATRFEDATGVTITVFSAFIPLDDDKGCLHSFPRGP